eukprot:CAMPEP_0206587940 /NCGR_PEP_ID=MMETSP0325_2-20121206/37961_1 /ASSEMBLY_ACC=CAM_ASM_000347 /TAXON_ID=2866 /ORGANISM="Crypthecodinium cohnii, Strain Seligo" /LENGTH=1066 /DNA_ID=CAMNT_0054096073 /DNA_START=275 /DNA_END=3474 /DNA_ORIENTATION=+
MQMPRDDAWKLRGGVPAGVAAPLLPDGGPAPAPAISKAAPAPATSAPMPAPPAAAPAQAPPASANAANVDNSLPENWPWRRSLASGSSLGLLPFVRDENDPPADPIYSLSNPDTKIMKEIGPPSKNPPPRKEHIVWVHLHNYAGTNICDKGKESGERISTKNCCWPGDNVMGRSWGEKFAHHAKCIERSTQEITLSMIERGLEKGDLGCENSISGVMLREPFKGARSTVLYQGFQGELDLLQSVIAGDKPLPKIGEHRGVPGQFSYQFFDNFVTRSLSGEFHLPPGKVTRAQLEVAKEVLKRIDIIMVLEEVSDHIVQLEQLFKWPAKVLQFRKKVNGHAKDDYKKVSREQEEKFKSQNQLDYELFEFGKKLAWERTAFAKSLPGSQIPPPTPPPTAAPPHIEMSWPSVEPEKWPWRQVPSGQSLQLLPFIPDPEDPPQDPTFSLVNPDTNIMREIERPPLHPVKRREHIIWVHLHNYAGTNICEKGKQAGERISTKNCCWPGDNVMGRSWGEEFAHHAKCSERSVHEITLSMLERGLEQGDLGCENSISGVMLREPFKGARSTVLYHGFDGELDTFQAVIAGERKLPKIGEHRGLPGKFSYQFFDNFVTRSLSGEFDLPPGNVTRKQLEVAMEVLKRIDVILILEEVSEHVIQLEQLFKWPAKGLPFERKVNGHNDDDYKRVSPEQEAKFKSQNPLDYELFEFGKKLAWERTNYAKSLGGSKLPPPTPAPAPTPPPAPVPPPAPMIMESWPSVEPEKWPWRQLPSGESLSLPPFVPDPQDPPADPLYSLANPNTQIMREIEPVPQPPLKRREHIVWVHLHNYAGTNICEKGKLSGERISTKNCCWPGDNVMGRSWGEKFAHHAKCSERSTREITLSMIERGLEQGDLGCANSISGVMLREPFKGARSTVLYHSFQGELDTLQAAIGGEKPLPRVGEHRGVPGKFSYQFFDNFVTRSLSGDFDVPPGQVSRKQLDIAKEVLRRIDVILILEEVNNHTVQLEKFFQWPSQTVQFSRKVNGHSDTDYLTVSKEQEDKFKSQNALDYELWELGKQLAWERTNYAKAMPS